MGQVHKKVVLKYAIAVSGEQCVMTDSRTQLQELFATCWDTGRSLTLRIYLSSVDFSAIGSLFYATMYVYFCAQWVKVIVARVTKFDTRDNHEKPSSGIHSGPKRLKIKTMLFKKCLRAFI